MADRTVRVKLVADVGDYTSALTKAAAETRGLGGEADRNVVPAMRRAAAATSSLGQAAAQAAKQSKVSIESLTAQVKRSREAMGDAADALKLAEMRLTEAREKGNVKGASMLALEQRLDKARRNLANSTESVAKAERGLAAAIADSANEEQIRATGEKRGGVLAQGLNQGLIRNSPLIVAGVSAALSAGAPAVLAGATTLFAGIGAVAAAQNVEVRSAWANMWDEMVDSATADAQVLVPVFVRMADEIGASFQRMRPLLQDAFEAVGPQIDTFVDSLTQAAENALPGLVRAVQQGGPVIEGLGQFLESVGTGVSDFFDAMSAHAPEAGQAFAAIGDILAELLPILGELLGQGAELAAVVLPPLASILGAVADAAQALGPLFPAIVSGIAALKIAQSAAGWVGGLGDKLKEMPGRISGLATGANVLGLAVGVVSAAFVAAQQRTEDWARALLEGGEAASVALAEMAQFKTAADEHTTGFRGLVETILGTNTAYQIMGGAVGDVGDTMKDLRADMDPVARAQANLRQATNDLSAALQGEGRYAGDVAGAQRNYEAASRASAAAQAELEMAIDGVTAAMIEQAEQALAAASSDFAYRSALEGIDDQLDTITEAQRQQAEAATAVAEAQREHGRGSEEAAEAQRNLDQATEATSDAIFALEGRLLAGATAAGEMARDASGLGDSLQGDQVAASATLSELVRLREEMGSNFPPALNNTIRGLEQSGAAIEGVSANAIAAKAQAASLIAEMFNLGQQKPRPTVDMNTVPFFGRLNTTLAAIDTLHGQRPTPVANLNGIPFFGGLRTVLNNIQLLHGQRPTPTASVNDRATPIIGGILGAINSIPASRTTTITAIYRSIYETIGSVPILGPAFRVATGGAIENGGVQHFATAGPVRGPGGPTADLVPAMLSNGEHVWSAREVAAAGGQAAVADMRRAVLAGREFSGASGSHSTVNVAAPSLTGLTIQGRMTVDGDGIATIAGRVVDQTLSAANSRLDARGRYQ